MREQINTNQQNGKGTDEFTFKRLELSEKYLATLTKDLKSDLVTALSTRNVIQFQNIDLQEFLYNGNVGKEQFLDNLITRKSQIQAAAYRYNVEPKYLSEAETDGLIATFKKLEDPEKIKAMSPVLQAVDLLHQIYLDK